MDNLFRIHAALPDYASWPYWETGIYLQKPSQLRGNFYYRLAKSSTPWVPWPCTRPRAWRNRRRLEYACSDIIWRSYRRSSYKKLVRRHRTVSTILPSTPLLHHASDLVYGRKFLFTFEVMLTFRAVRPLLWHPTSVTYTRCGLSRLLYVYVVPSPGAKTINVFRACLRAQLTICAQKWRNFVLFSTVSMRFVLSRVCVFLYSLGPWSLSVETSPWHRIAMVCNSITNVRVSFRVTKTLKLTPKHNHNLLSTGKHTFASRRGMLRHLIINNNSCWFLGSLQLWVTQYWI